MKTYIIRNNIIVGVFVLCVTLGFSQDQVERPTFPDVFQTEVQGLFIEEDRPVEMDGSLYYDKQKNRAAMSLTFKNEIRKMIYNFDSNEYIYINAGDCTVDSIPDDPNQSYFPFEMDKNKKKILMSADHVFFFTNSKFNRQIFSVLPTLIYTATIDIPLYRRKNCNLTHVFSKPVIEMPDCSESKACKSTLMTVSVQCINKETNTMEVNHVYEFFRFRSEIKDESIFQVPVGQYCELKNAKTFPKFPSYFSFSFEIIVDAQLSDNDISVSSKNKKVWYDADHRIIRIDEYDKSDLMLSSRVFDLISETGFTIISTLPICTVGPASRDLNFGTMSTLPKIFFSKNDSVINSAVYVGKRKVHGLTYQVWTLSGVDSFSEAKIVQEIYFLEINISKEKLSIEKLNDEPYMQVSHVDTYTYEEGGEADVYDLSMLKHLSINNFRTEPKDFAAFDVAPCFQHQYKKDFILKLKGLTVVKDSHAYREIIKNLYEAISNVTGISIIRISELRGVFDGIQLEKIKGSILDNSNSSGWQKITGELGMDETVKVIKAAANDGKLSVTITKENNEKSTYLVTFEEETKPPSGSNGCYSGATMAAASLVLLLIGIAFGVAGYYVFLKKRKKVDDGLSVHYVKSSI